MSFEERNALSSLATSLLAWAIMGGTLWRRWQEGAFDGPLGLQAWAEVMLWLIGLAIGLGIVLTILLAIIDGLIRGREAASTRTDERDQLISLLAHRIVLGAVSAGLILAVVLLARGWSAVAALTLIVASCAVGDTIATGYKVWRYRRGF